MINQFLYGRTQNGFKELSNVGQAGYSQEDVTGFQHLWVYELADGCDRNLKPESRSFYVSESAIGLTAQVGKTTFVPAGTSKESGNRDTTLLHKYLLSGDDFRTLMACPSHIFEERKYCTTVEEAKEYIEEMSSEIMTAKDGEQFSAAELLEYFGIPQDRLPEFLYAVLDAAGNVDTRLYIALPEWNKKGTDMALQLCEKILNCLPTFLVSSCGFLTYTKTYHNSQTNMIPRSVKIIFYPNNFENQKKYNVITEKNYVVDGSAGLFPQVDTNPYTVDMVSAMAEYFMTGEKDNVWYPFFEKFYNMILSDISVAPEAVSCACKFLELKEQMDNNEEIRFDIDEIYFIVENYLDCKEFITQSTVKCDMAFLEKFAEVFTLDGDLLNILCDFYLRLPESKEFVITWICRKLVEHIGNPEIFNAVLNYSYESPELIANVKKRIYADLDFYPAARYLELLNHEEAAAKLKDWNELVDLLYTRMDALYEEWSDFLTDPDTVAMIEELVDRYCMDEGVRRISVEELRVLYERADKFAKKNIATDFTEIVQKFVRQLLTVDIVEKLEPHELKLMKEWRVSLKENEEFGSEEYEEVFGILNRRIIVMEYRELLENGDGEGCVARWKEDGPKKSKTILERLTFDKEKMYEKLSFQVDDTFDEFFFTLFMSRPYERKEILQEIMKNRNGHGGIIAMECLWQNISIKGNFLWDEKTNMKYTIQDIMREHYLKNGVSQDEAKDIKSVMEFAEEMRVSNFANDSSVMGKLKNLTGGLPTFGKKKEETVAPMIPSWKSKDSDKKKW